MNRSAAVWLSMISVLTVAALAIATIGLVLGAKASDEKADEGNVTQQIDEVRGEIGDLEAEVEALQSSIDEVAGTIDGLASEEAEQVDTVATIDAAVNELGQRLDEVEELLGLDEQ